MDDEFTEIEAQIVGATQTDIGLKFPEPVGILWIPFKVIAKPHPLLFHGATEKFRIQTWYLKLKQVF